MSGSQHPSEPPPSYAQATGSSAASGSAGASSSNNVDTTHLSVPGSSDGKLGVPASYRRSMEDEQRPLPSGWVRTYDPSTEHQFYVDTSKDPPRSIWVHPHDDDEYLATLPTEERERIEQDSMNRGKHHPSKEEILNAGSDDDENDHQHASAAAGASSSAFEAQLPPRPDGKGKAPERTFGRKLKDKLTGMTHDERVVERRQRAQAERQMYEQHMHVRAAMTRAMQTGQPQYLGKDRDGKDVYIEPPAPPPQFGGYPGGRYGGGGYGYSPWGGPGGPGIYNAPNARYIRPQGPYSRGGSGMGMPLAIGGGLLGGLLLGDLLF